MDSPMVKGIVKGLLKPKWMESSPLRYPDHHSLFVLGWYLVLEFPGTTIIAGASERGSGPHPSKNQYSSDTQRRQTLSDVDSVSWGLWD